MIRIRASLRPLIAMVFALAVEMLNMRSRRKKDAHKKAALREEAAHRHSVV